MEVSMKNLLLQMESKSMSDSCMRFCRKNKYRMWLVSHWGRRLTQAYSNAPMIHVWLNVWIRGGLSTGNSCLIDLDSLLLLYDKKSSHLSYWLNLGQPEDKKHLRSIRNRKKCKKLFEQILKWTTVVSFHSVLWEESLEVLLFFVQIMQLRVGGNAQTVKRDCNQFSILTLNFLFSFNR